MPPRRSAHGRLCACVIVLLVCLTSVPVVGASWRETVSSIALPFARPLARDDVGPCLNGATWDGSTCTCPIYYTGPRCADRQCPNSIGGEGEYHILPVNPDTKVCDGCNTKDYDGLNCQLCQRDDACRRYGSDIRCNRDIVIRGNNKNFQCGLRNDFFLNLMGDGKRNITAEIVLDCATDDGTAFGNKENGACSMAIYRIEPNNEYVDPFFRCRASRCSMVLEDKEKDTSKDESAEETQRDKVFRVARVSGQVTLVVLCTVLALIGTCSKQLGSRRMKCVTATLAVLIVIVVTLYIFVTALSMQTAPLEQTVVYECKETDCACAQEPPSRRYEPICSESVILNNTILPAIKNSIRIRCGTANGVCTLTLTDITLIFDAQCRASECVNETAFPDGPPPDPSVLRYQRYMTALFALVVLLCAGGVVHWYTARKRSAQRAKDFLILFHVPTAADDADGSDGPVSRNRHDGGAGATAVNELDEESEEGPLLSGSGHPSSSPQSAVSIRESVYRRAAALTPDEQTEVQRVRELNRSPLELRVSSLHYTLTGPCLASREEAAPRVILDNIHFSIHSGEVLAIMGPSGAGKTSLLDLLSARTKAGHVGGEIALNGTPISISRRTSTQYRNLIGYVSQEDTLLPALTVKQTIEYAARLKLPQAFSHRTIDHVVQQIIERMRLSRCAHTLVGNGSTIRGISGGERRRVSIAVELLANPRILFIDEPTSGLDAVSARHVTEAVVELAKDSPMRMYAPFYFSFRPIVIFSIHQPSTEIYNLFDQILLLSHGVSVYCGPARGAATILEARVKTALGPTRRVPSHADDPNPAEYLMRLEEYLDDGARTELQREDIACSHDRRTQREATAYMSATVPSPNVLTTEQPQAPPHQRTPSPGAGYPTEDSGHVTFSRDAAEVDGASIMAATTGFRLYYANVYEQLAILTSRATACLIGSFHLVVCHSAVVACMATLMSFLYKEQELDLPGALNRAGSTSFLLLVTSFVSLSCLEQLIVERKLFIVERENGFYVTFSYLMSKVFVDIVPLRVIPSVVLSSIIYYPMGFRTDSGTHFYWFILIIVLFSVCQTLIVFSIGIVAGSFGAAALISSIIILWNFVFGGALVQAQTIPAALKPFQRVSPFFLAFESLLVNELDGQACMFSPTDETGKSSAAHIPIMCVQYLANLGLQPERFASDVMQLTLYCFLLLALAWLLLATCTKLVR